eukprot:EG_transcript_22309
MSGCDNLRSTEAEPTPTLVLGYWPTRGRAAPLRMMLAYAGVPYEDRRHEPDNWFNQTKPELSQTNALANLPYLQDGDRCIAQSHVCILYLGAKLGLDPTDVLDPRALSNMQVLNEIADVRTAFNTVCYPFMKVSRSQEEFEANRTAHLKEKLPPVYAKLERHLSQAGTAFFSADTPLSADFHVWETLDQQEAFARSAGVDSLLAAYPKLQKFYAAFRALPQLQKYFASDAFRLPFNIARANPWFPQ